MSRRDVLGGFYSALVKEQVDAELGAIGYINISDLDDSVKRVEVVDSEVMKL